MSSTGTNRYVPKLFDDEIFSIMKEKKVSRSDAFDIARDYVYIGKSMENSVKLLGLPSFFDIKRRGGKYSR